MEKSFEEKKQEFVDALKSMGVQRIEDIPEGTTNRFFETGFENSIPFEIPNTKSLEERQKNFVEALNAFGITDIKDISEGCYNPPRERQEVWIVK